jgi:hypothetical protein
LPSDDTGGCYLDIDSGAPVPFKLNATDADVSPSGSPRSFMTVTGWPKLGTLYQA